MAITTEQVEVQLQSLIDSANEVTGNSDTNITDSIDALIGGYGVGGEPTLQDKTITENGTYTPDSGFDGFSEVTVNVDAEPTLQDKTITENGIYTADGGFDGLGTVTVNVDAEPTLQDKTITENGTYTHDRGYDGLGEVTVNVAGSDGGGVNLYFTKTICTMGLQKTFTPLEISGVGNIDRIGCTLTIGEV